MIIPCGRKFYLASKDQTPVGVFSSLQKAQAAEHDSITEIEPFLLEGSPVSEEYLCMISGSCSLLRRRGDSFFSEYVDIGPFWGVNPQSAAAYLCRLGGRSIQCKQFLLFRIDQEYAPGQPNSLHASTTFSSLVSVFSLSELVHDSTIATDYIALYFRRVREAEEYAAKANLPETGLLTDYLIKLVYKRAPSDGLSFRCGTPLLRDRQRLRHALICEFSMDELKQLSVLLGLTDPTEETPCSIENSEDLLRRVGWHVPRVIAGPLTRKMKYSLD